MEAFDELTEVVRRLRAEDGCPWDREQTHMSLKPACIEEAAEVICGINVYDRTGNPENMKEELGDLLLQVVMHAQIASEEGLFTLEDVVNTIKEKMIRRHPHVFGDTRVNTAGEVLLNWEQIKAGEKKGRTDVSGFLPAAFEEAVDLIETARKWKGFLKRVHVVAAVLRKEGKIFATQRGYGDYKDWWEFPGGKVEPGESAEQALEREIREELAVKIQVGKFLGTVEYDYPDFHLVMDCFQADVREGELTLLEHEAARWLSLDELDQVKWLPADVEVIKLILESKGA